MTNHTDKNDTLGVWLLACAMCFMLGAVFGNCGGSMARAGEVPELSPALALARLCVNESGLRAYTHGDCAAIHQVILFRAEHIYHSTYVEALHRYSRNVVRDIRRRRSRLWIVDLQESLRLPAGWNPHAGHWLPRNRRSGDQRRWQLSMQHARDVQSGEVVTECYGVDEDGAPVLRQPHTWANDTVSHDHLSELDCMDTLNVFWSVPRYARRWPAEWPAT